MRTKKPFLQSPDAAVPHTLGRRFFLKLLGAAGVAATTDADAGCSLPSEYSDVEYIVIGSGAGGGPLAANLARNGRKVLLVEAGADNGGNPIYQVPAFHPASAEDPAMSWPFYVSHYTDPAQQSLDPKTVVVNGQPRIYYPRGGTLGGCTAHSPMITLTAQDFDWNDIAKVTGDDSWSAENMLRYFKALESCDYLPRGTPGHGFDGWFHIATLDPTFTMGDVNNDLANVLTNGGKLLRCALSAAYAMGQIGNGDPAFPGKVRGDTDTFVGAAKELYTLLRRDPNEPGPIREDYEGVINMPLSTFHGRRRQSRDYIIDTASAFPDHLLIRTDTLVTRVLFDGKRAVGIEYIDAPHVYRADPNAIQYPEALSRRVLTAPGDLPKLREIIVAGGAFNTPQLLKLSGVGPKDELAQFGIPVVVDLPGVGENLQDRYEVTVVNTFTSDLPVSQCDWKPSDPKQDPCYQLWETGKGPYISNSLNTAVLKRSMPGEPAPDLIILLIPGKYYGYYPGYSVNGHADAHHFTWLIIKTHTHNPAGSVKLATGNPWDPPAINFRYFDDGAASTDGTKDDMRSLVEAVRFARQMSGTTNQMLDGGLTEQMPGPSVVTDADLEEFIKNRAFGHHCACSCKIGADGDPMAVLDSSFNVRGTTGLRVVDASVFPRIPGAFPMLPIYMIAEKATDVILSSIGQYVYPPQVPASPQPPADAGAGADATLDQQGPKPDGATAGDAPGDVGEAS